LSGPLLDRLATVVNDDETQVSVSTNADVVVARQEGRRIAARAGFTSTELAVIATAISEIARNIVKFAEARRSRRVGRDRERTDRRHRDCP
jgi:serine/threonine-protein kinase RsbT